MAPGSSPQLQSAVDTTSQFSRKVNKPFVRLQAGGPLSPWEAQASLRKGGFSVQRAPSAPPRGLQVARWEAGPQTARFSWPIQGFRNTLRDKIQRVFSLCSHHQGLIPEHFHHPTPEPCTHPLSLCLPLSSRWLPLTYFLCLRISLFQKRFKQDLRTIWGWLLSRGIVFKVQHVVTCDFMTE